MKKLVLVAIVFFAFACGAKKTKVQEKSSQAIEQVNEEVISSETTIEKKTEALEKKAEELDSKVDDLINNL